MGQSGEIAIDCSGATACAVRENRFQRLVREHPTANGASGLSDMAGKAAIGSGRAKRERARYNGANEMRDQPPLRLGRGRHRRVRAELEFLRSERCGQRVSLQRKDSTPSTRLEYKAWGISSAL